MGKRYNVKDCIRRGVWRNSPYHLVEGSRISLATRIQSSNVQESTFFVIHSKEILVNSIGDSDTKQNLGDIRVERA